jgi:S1-C subfamily serine protease
MIRERMILLTVSGACSFMGSFAAWRMMPGAHAADPVSGPVSIGGLPRAGFPDGMDRKFELVARQMMPAVVAVEAVRPPAQGRGKPVEESGSGVLVRLPEVSGIFALTNNHVIAGAPAEQITLSLSDNRVLRPSRVWADPESDIAVLRLDEANLPTAALGDSEGARVGQWVLAFGSPFGLNQTVTHGILSARERGQVSLGSTIRIKDFLQTDAAINPGSSGGPLLNLDSEVIGINTAIASTSGNNTGVSFSIPINRVKRVARDLLERGKVSRGYLGLQVAGAFDASDAIRLGLERHLGALVESVYPETPAAMAGLKPGDVLLKLDDIQVRDENHCINMIADLAPGRRVRLEFWRDRRSVVGEAVVGDWSATSNKLRITP